MNKPTENKQSSLPKMLLLVLLLVALVLWVYFSDGGTLVGLFI